MTVYLSSDVVRRLDQIQDELYLHLTGDGFGRCTSCGEIEPCLSREKLAVAILAYGVLPRRRPGLTKAGLRVIDPSTGSGAVPTS
jgi:hypothetical protein